MCKWGTHTILQLPRKGEIVPVQIDSCIVPFVQALNDAGFETIASCCGHGRVPGRISFRDGREFIIMSFDEAQQFYRDRRDRLTDD